MTGTFLRVLNARDKQVLLRTLVGGTGQRDAVFAVNAKDFRTIPGSPFAYWLSDRLRRTFIDLPPFEEAQRTAKLGIKADDDFRFLRLSFEHRMSMASTWQTFSKGGTYSPYYADLQLAVNWRDGGREMKTLALERWGNAGKRIYNTRFFGRPGLTWPIRTQSGLSIRALPAGCSFGHVGPCGFVSGDNQVDLLALLAVCDSSTFRFLVALQTTFGKFEVGVIQRTPVPLIDEESAKYLSGRCARAWSLRRSLDTRTEVSHAFVLPALLQVEGGSLAMRADAWAGRVRGVDSELAAIQAEIDERCFDLYGIDEADRGGIGEGLAGAVESSDAEDAEVDLLVDDGGDVDGAADASGLAAELVSWAVGVAFGRFDVRLATGARELPGVPEPFDPLPVCSPGMLVGGDGLPVAVAPSGYPVDFPVGGVLVDDLGDSRDLTGAVRTVFDRVFGMSADALWDEAAALLDPRSHGLRAWLRSGFFDHHLKLHSKSRRKAPILWQLGTPSGRYSVWLYAHQLTEDSLFQLQHDVLAQKLAYEERQLTSLVQSSGGSASAKERRTIEAQEAFVEELRVLLEEVRRVAPLWKPTLDDGIVLVMAPLWRLVPHKPWQRELKKKWEELAAGKYDWAQLAMHLWPERVAPKCAKDRSLAIAHGLEDVFWVEDEDGKWQPREEPTASVDELIHKRTSSEVMAALSDVSRPANSDSSRPGHKHPYPVKL